MNYPPNMQPPPQPYGYPQPYVYYGPPPPPPSNSGKIVVIIIAVVIIAFVVIPAAVSFYLVWSMQNMMKGIDVNTASASVSISKFDNPYEAKGTYNHGGWQVRVTSVSGPKPLLATVSLNLNENVLMYTQMQHVDPADVSLSYTSGAQNQWYLKKYATSTPKFMDSGKSKNLTVSTAKDIGPGEFETVQNAYMIYIDSDADGYFSSGDVIYIYSCVNGDSNPEVTSGFTIQILGGTAEIASRTLN